MLVVIADQWRAQAFGFAGDPNVKTPNMNKLCAQSACFTNAVSGLPVCSPMRATMLTGQRPLTHGVFINDIPLNPDAVSIGKVFGKAGYDTGFVGKWHIALSGIAIPSGVEGLDYSGHARGGPDPGDSATVILCAAPFGEWTRKMGGREYRGVRTDRYTFVRDLNGPWLLYDNETDPLQMNNLVNKPESAELQTKMDALLAKKLKDRGDEFKPGEDYLAKWHYKVDANGTMPYK